MNRVIMFSTGVFAACSVFLLAATGGVNAAKGPQPQPYYGEILEKMARVLPGMHLSHQKLDDSVSCKAWTNLITSFDFDHSYFLQEDLDRFAGMELKIDDAVQSGDVSFGYEIYRLFQKRLDERYTFVTNMLAHPISFNEEESYTWKRKNAPWPADPAEQDDLWRRRIKNELLISRLSRELDIANASNKTDKAAAPVKTEP